VGGGGLSALQRADKDLSKDKLQKKNCGKDLDKLGLEPEDIRQGAKAANIINGTGSQRSLSSLYSDQGNPGIQKLGSSVQGTVGEDLAKPGHVAVAELGGNDIYVDPAKINPADYFFNKATAFHEVIHNITGMTDPDIQRALGLKENVPSENITKKLEGDCF